MPSAESPVPGKTAARFSSATLDELWSHGHILERRLSHGEAFEDERGITASDARDDLLVASCLASMDRMRALVLPDLRMRFVATATKAGVVETITASMAGRSVVTAPEHVQADVALLRSCADPPAAVEGRPGLPMLWKNGTAAVLLHEAFGHPLEHRHGPVDWPQWLSIDAPLALRRATFGDVPLTRMTTLTARQTNAPFSLPEQRIEVLLVDGGAYEPLTEIVTVTIGAADLVAGGRRSRMAPFQLSDSRAAIARAVTGASGDPIRYPGVICSREGQELVVGSFAPLLLMEHA